MRISDWSSDVCSSDLMAQVNLYEAKTNLSSLVDRAAAGEEIVIAKNGQPMARLVAMEKPEAPRVPGKVIAVTYIAEDFDEPAPEIVEMFEGRAISRASCRERECQYV